MAAAVATAMMAMAATVEVRGAATLAIRRARTSTARQTPPSGAAGVVGAALVATAPVVAVEATAAGGVQPTVAIPAEGA